MQKYFIFCFEHYFAVETHIQDDLSVLCLSETEAAVRGSNLTKLSNDPKLYKYIGREPWSSGCGRRLMFKRLWVRIPDGHGIFCNDLL